MSSKTEKPAQPEERKRNPLFGLDRMAHAKPCTTFDEIYEVRRKRLAGRLIDPAQVRRDRDWEFLATKLVGGVI